jgi:hypothetical protein
MRLIDKDKLINEVSRRNYSQASMRLLREQPEVEAIPIEWIKKKSLEFLTNRNFRYATDFQEVIDMWKVENNIPLFDGELKITMEKENDRNQT